MKRILLVILVTGILLLGACGSVELTHYVNEEFGYSIDYPADWLLEDLSDNEIGIKPEEASTYTQIQISGFEGQPSMDVLSDDLLMSANESTLQLLADDMEALSLEISVNERSEGQWDWVVEYTMTLKDESTLQGGLLIKATATVTYNIFYIYSGEWPEGLEAINSFTPTGITETEGNNGE